MKPATRFKAVMDRMDVDDAERTRARHFWKSIRRGGDETENEEEDAWRDLLVEDAVMLRVISWRLLGSLGKETILDTKGESAAARKITLHPAVEALARTQERLRKVMKELREQEKVAGTKLSLPEIMMPILAKTEGVLENALRPRRGEEDPEESEPPEGGDGSMAGDS